MNIPIPSILRGLALALMLGLVAGCQTNDGSAAVTHNYYYGSAYYDPWYHGYYDDADNVVVTPPRPDNPPDNGLRPAHPIAQPPVVRPSPRPSIPTTPRPAPRGGGGRRR